MKTNSLPWRGWMQSAGRVTPSGGLACFGGSGFVFGGLGQMGSGRFGEEMRLTFGMRGQQFASGKGIGIEAVGDVFGAGPGERIEGETVAQGRIAGDQKHAAGGKKPGLAGPPGVAGTGGDAAQGEDVAGQAIKPLFED